MVKRVLVWASGLVACLALVICLLTFRTGIRFSEESGYGTSQVVIDHGGLAFRRSVSDQVSMDIQPGIFQSNFPAFGYPQSNVPPSNPYFCRTSFSQYGNWMMGVDYVRYGYRTVGYPRVSLCGEVTVLIFPLWQLLLLGIFPIRSILFWHRLRGRIRDGLCLECGYNLMGNVSGVCPECGNPTKALRLRGVFVCLIYLSHSLVSNVARGNPKSEPC
jgi:hypothetical protein